MALRRAKKGSLVRIYSHPTRWDGILGDPLAKGYDSLPSEHGYHRAVWVAHGLGIVVEKCDTYCRVLIHEKSVWFEEHQFDVVKR